MANSDASSLRTEVKKKKLFLFAEAFENTRKFKISMERINLHLTFISLMYFSGKEKRDSGNG